MLVSVNEVSERLKISTRAVQIKCKRAKLKKIGNRYQITEEIANVWYNAAENQPLTPTNEPEPNPERTEVSAITSRKTPVTSEKRSSFVSFAVILLLILLVSVSVLFYINLDDQITEAKATISKKGAEHKIEVKVLSKKLNDAQDVIHNQELEIQSLKYKDSLKVFKKW
jgi:competence protein ComGC